MPRTRLSHNWQNTEHGSQNTASQNTDKVLCSKPRCVLDTTNVRNLVALKGSFSARRYWITGAIDSVPPRIFPGQEVAGATEGGSLPPLGEGQDEGGPAFAHKLASLSLGAGPSLLVPA